MEEKVNKEEKADKSVDKGSDIMKKTLDKARAKGGTEEEVPDSQDD